MFLSLEASAHRWGALLLALSLLACRTELQPAGDPMVIYPVVLEPDVTKVPYEAPGKETLPEVPSLFLELRSLKGGNVSGATVQLASGKRAQTDDSGQLLMEKLRPGLQLLHVQAPEFAPSLAALHLEEGVRAGASLALLPLGEPFSFEASKGIQKESAGLQLIIQENALYDEKGALIQGPVDAFLASLNLEGGELLAAPGSMEGIIGSGAQPVGLESLGVVVLILQQNGKDIPFAKRIRFRGRGPGSIRASSQKPLPAAVPAWRLEQETGRWSPTGDMGFIEEDPQQPAEYVWDVTVDNPSPVLNVALPYWWRSESANADNPLQPPEPQWVETACLKVRVEEKGGQPVRNQKEGRPVAGRTVVARGVGYMGMSRGVTDESGQVLLEVMRNQFVDLDAGEARQEEDQPDNPDDGRQVRRVFTGPDAGPCNGPDAKPVPITLKVDEPQCTPGEAQDCPYGGSAETLDVGICRAPRKYCDATGNWSKDCRGEVTPHQEQCDNALDDDCDGTVNDECASVCKEGDEDSCAGTEDVRVCGTGKRKCLAGGTAWSACEGQELPKAVEDCSQPGDEDCDGVACQCWPGQVKKCPYNGQEVGACRASTQTCNASGTEWGACTGEVTPQPELCINGVDDDCDGAVDEGCVCEPTNTRSCYTGTPNTQGKGLCKDGIQTCNASGTDWGACMGEVLPQAESCTTDVDDDCDGLVNEDCSCTLGATQSCYTGPQQTRGQGLCQDGNQTCTASGWDVCTGEVRPQVEICTNGVDDNCDGMVDENPPCGWVSAGSLREARFDHTATLLNGDKVLVTGGDTGGSWALRMTEVYDPVSKTSSISYMNSSRARHTATLLSGGKVLVTGGYNGNDESHSFATAEVYDPVSNTWLYTQNAMNSARRKHSATLLGNGKVLVAGGWRTDGTSYGVYIKSAEVYNPASETWSQAGTMESPRNRHTATLLNNGKVLVAGGQNNSYTSLNTAEVYDPNNTNAPWSSAGNMTWARRGHAATLLSDGKVLVTGGFGASGNVLKTAEVYDPNNTNPSWSPARDMARARSGHTATLLRNGKVLVSGGQDASGALAQAEVYDPVNDTWSPVDDMAFPRKWHTETLLSTGQVLVTGGHDGGKALNTAELYPGPPSP